jgi:hypothetical protein
MNNDGILRIVSGQTKSIDAAKRTVRAVLSSETVDRYGDVILAKSFNSPKNFKNYFDGNPIVLWAHGKDSAFGNKPIGSCANPTFEGRDMNNELAFEGDIIFTDAFQGAEDIWRLYKAEVCKCFSVGLIPLVIGKEAKKEGQTGVTFMEVELLENSAVPIPANPAAMRKAFIDGDVSEDFLVNTFFQLRDHVVRHTDIFVPLDWNYKASINALEEMKLEFAAEDLELKSQFTRKRRTLQPVETKSVPTEEKEAEKEAETEQVDFECFKCQADKTITVLKSELTKPENLIDFCGEKIFNVTCPDCKTSLKDVNDIIISNKLI